MHVLLQGGRTLRIWPQCGLYVRILSLAVIHEVSLLTNTLLSNSSSSNLDEWGARILDAIDNIPIPPALPINSVLGVTHPPVQGLNPGPDCIPTGRSPIVGLFSILEWQIFNIQGERGPLIRYKQALSDHPDQRPLSQATGRESATCAPESLLKLADIFQAGFLPAIPVLNPADLRRYILHIGEYGDMWNVEACLVLIVAALASMLRPTSAFPQHVSSTISMALRYWNMAKKRLAWALEGSGMVAAQCQLLAAYGPPLHSFLNRFLTEQSAYGIYMYRNLLQLLRCSTAYYLPLTQHPPVTMLLLAREPATDGNRKNYAATSGTYVSVCCREFIL